MPIINNSGKTNNSRKTLAPEKGIVVKSAPIEQEKPNSAPPTIALREFQYVDASKLNVRNGAWQTK